jgi:argininosuccinate lyase
MKLWEKGIPVNKAIEEFTVGKDRELDLYLAPFDILGSMAHITMLESVGLIEKNELPVLLQELKKLYQICFGNRYMSEQLLELQQDLLLLDQR